MFVEYGKKFTFQDYKNKVDGIPRVDGGRAILTELSTQELVRATDKKQEYFLEYLKREKIPVFKTTIKLIKELKSKGRQFNNEVQHLGEQKGSCYPKCLWEDNIII